MPVEMQECFFERRKLESSKKLVGICAIPLVKVEGKETTEYMSRMDAACPSCFFSPVGMGNLPFPELWGHNSVLAEIDGRF